MANTDVCVLIIEDNPMDAAMLVNMVSKFTNDITVSTSAERGAFVFRQALQGGESYQLLITDINLPGKSGKEMIREVREIEDIAGCNVQARIIAVSADPPSMHLLDACRVGAGCYLEKPVTKDKLSEALLNTGLFT